jgi:hypothetical protein
MEGKGMVLKVSIRYCVTLLYILQVMLLSVD